PEGEVDAQAFARDIASALMHIRSEHHLKRFEKEMMGCVVADGLFCVISESSSKFLCCARARKRLMLHHFSGHLFFINNCTTFFRNLLSHFNGKAICCIKIKDHITWKNLFSVSSKRTSVWQFFIRNSHPLD